MTFKPGRLAFTILVMTTAGSILLLTSWDFCSNLEKTLHVFKKMEFLAPDSSATPAIPSVPWRSRSRDVMWQQPWRERESDERRPPDVLPTVHYLWCGQQKFRFHHYLGLLSAIRVVHPTKIVLHYTDLPQTDDYNVWFEELKSSFMDLELQQIDKALCNEDVMLKTALSFFSSFGGYFIGPGMVIARPLTFQGTATAWYATSGDPSKVIVAVKAGFNASALHAAMKSSLAAGSASTTKCVTVDSFSEASPCVVLETALYPRDIVTSATGFAELARWLFYGRREKLEPKRDPKNLVPRLCHVIKLKATNPGAMYNSGELSFNHYLSILSALYVGGFQRVFFHTEEMPTGKWWEDLQKENVTLLPVDPVRSVFQQEIKVVQHMADLLRYQVLNKYGGTYQDFDVVWASRVPDWLLEYPAVLGFEWVQHPEFPETINNGVLMAQAGSAWLRHFIASHLGNFRDHQWAYNSLLMSYRTFELYPDLVLLDRHLQVLCYEGTCHPAWQDGYVRAMSDGRKTPKIGDWKTEVRAFHVTGPKPHPSLDSPASIATRKGLFAAVGKHILEKSGRLHLLPK